MVALLEGLCDTRVAVLRVGAIRPQGYDLAVMRLLLITGAGASRELAYEGETMPLMGDWSEQLYAALDEREPGLALACGLKPMLSGPDFERTMGELLRWRQDQYLAEKFRPLAALDLGARVPELEDGFKRTEIRLTNIMEVLNTSLYRQFGQNRVDEERASSAYGWLLSQLGSPELVVATTNYDRSAEAGLRQLGHTVATGFHPLGERAPVFRPRGLLRGAAEATPVLHLHGAVGWYATGGNVEDHFADRVFNATLGSPVVLYPDPDKDPTTEVFVGDLWEEFREAALEWADHILVIGHSLSDPPVVRVLQLAADRAKLGVGYIDPAGEKRASETFRDDAIPIHLEFGPSPIWAEDALAKWAL